MCEFDDDIQAGLLAAAFNSEHLDAESTELAHKIIELCKDKPLVVGMTGIGSAMMCIAASVPYEPESFERIVERMVMAYRAGLEE